MAPVPQFQTADAVYLFWSVAEIKLHYLQADCAYNLL
jgi:hypothetical protein